MAETAALDLESINWKRGEARIETGRVRREEAAEAVAKAQADVYQVGGALARIEQQIQHQRELGERLQKARDEAQNALNELGQHISGDETRLGVLRASVDEIDASGVGWTFAKLTIANGAIRSIVGAV